MHAYLQEQVPSSEYEVNISVFLQLLLRCLRNGIAAVSLPRWLHQPLLRGTAWSLHVLAAPVLNAFRGSLRIALSLTEPADSRASCPLSEGPWLSLCTLL